MYFMMFPLWMMVTEVRLLWSAQSMAVRTMRSEPSMEIGFNPIAEVAGKRILTYCFGEFFLQEFNN